MSIRFFTSCRTPPIYLHLFSTRLAEGFGSTKTLTVSGRAAPKRKSTNTLYTYSESARRQLRLRLRYFFAPINRPAKYPAVWARCTACSSCSSGTPSRYPTSRPPTSPGLAPRSPRRRGRQERQGARVRLFFCYQFRGNQGAARVTVGLKLLVFRQNQSTQRLFITE